MFRRFLELPSVLQRMAGDLRRLQVDVVDIKMKVKEMSQALDNLKAAVAAQTTIDASAKTLIEGIAAQLAAKASANDDADLQALADQLTAASAPLADAVAANTPAQPQG